MSKPKRSEYWTLDIDAAQNAYEQIKVMFYAISNNDVDIIIKLIASGAYIDEKFLEKCINHERKHMIFMIIEAYPYQIKVSRNVLSKLASKYILNRTLLKYIIDECDVNNMYDLFDPLVHASIHGDIELIHLIVSKFPCACNMLYSPFFWGAKSGQRHIVSYIYDLCKNIDEMHMNNTLLNVIHDCCVQHDKIYSCASVMRFLISRQKASFFHCIEKCFEKQNAFILALFIPFLHHGYFTNETPLNIELVCKALRMRRAIKVITKWFLINRRLILARTLYKAMHSSYSPSIMQVIAQHGCI
jgi:hypothetical protein